MRRSHSSWRFAAAAAAALTIFNCTDLGPEGPWPASLGLIPAFESEFASAVDVSSLQLVLLREDSLTVAADTTIELAADADSVDVSINVSLLTNPETFYVLLTITDTEGNVVFEGATTVTAVPGDADPAVVEIVYVGVGFDAADVVITSEIAQVVEGESLRLTAVALDSSQIAIEGTPIIWTSEDPTRATIPDRDSGLVQTLRNPGPVDIAATLLTGQSATTTIDVVPAVPTGLVIVDGNNQTVPAGTAVTVPPRVRVVDQIDRPLSGVLVTFAVAAGGGSITGATATTDASGEAAVGSWILGTQPGANTLIASVDAGVEPIVATFNAIGAVGGGQLVNWIDGEGGNWNNGASWSTGSPPTSLDTALIVLPGTYTVSIDTDVSVQAVILGSQATGTQRLRLITGSLTAAQFSLVDASGQLDVEGGTVTIPNGLIVSGDFGWTGGTLTGGGVVIIDPLGRLFLQLGPLTLDDGHIEIGGTAFWDSGDIAYDNASSIDVLFGGSIETTGNRTLSWDGTGEVPAFFSGGVLTLAQSVDDTLSVQGLVASGPGSLLQGDGTLDLRQAEDIVGSTRIGPGRSPGRLRLLGPLFDLDPLDTLDIELGGQTPGTEHDVVEFDGDVVLSGALAVSLLNYTPVVGDTFQILQFASRTGDFTGITGLDLGGGLRLDTVFTANALTLVAVPQMSGLNLVRWTNAAGGDFNDPANWSTNTVPTTTDSAVIDEPGTYTVTLTGGASVGALSVDGLSGAQTLAVSSALLVAGTTSVLPAGVLDLQIGGAFTNDGTANVSGNFSWTGGTLQGSGVTRIESDGAFGISGANSKNLDAHTIQNLGGTTWSGGTVFLSQSARFENSGTFTDQNTTGSQWDQSGANIGTFVNDGIFSRLGSGVSVYDIEFINNGTLQIQVASNMSLLRQSTIGGGVVLVGESQLQFNGGTHSIASGATISGAGDVTISSGTVSVDGAIATVDNLQLAGGTLTGSGTVTVNSLFSWSAGTLSGTGALVVDALASASIFGGNNKTFQTRTINNSGTFNWSGGTVFASDFATFNNLGTFQDQNTAAVQWDQSGANLARFVNQATGTFTKNGTGATTYDVAFDNGGDVDIVTGRADLARGGNSIGNFTVQTGATLGLAGSGSDHLISTGTMSGTGTVNFFGGTSSLSGTYALSGVTDVSGGTAEFNVGGATTDGLTIRGAGNLSGTGQLTAVTDFDWQGGTISGSGSLIIGSGVSSGTISSGFNKTLLTRTVTNDGIVDWTGGTVFAGDGALFENTNFFSDLNTTAVQWDQTGAVVATFSNTGEYIRSGTGATTIDVEFVNSATVSVVSGELSLTRQSTLGGGATIASGSALRFDGGTHSMSSGATFSGAGDLVVNNGTVSVDGAIVSAENLQLNGGTLDGAGTLTVNTFFDWTGGTLSGAGALDIDALASATISGGFNKTFATRTINNAGAVTWSGGTIFASDFATFNNSGSFQDANTAAVQWDLSGANLARFVNQATGTFTRNGTGTTIYDVAFDNGGDVDIATGRTDLARGGNSIGNFTVQPGATLGLGGGGGSDHVLSTGSIGGGGTINFFAGTSTVSGTYALSGLTDVTGGVAAFDAAGSTTSDLIIRGAGTLGGAGQLTAVTGFDWQGGTIDGTGSLVIGVGVTAGTISSNFNKTLLTRTVTNNGTVDWTGGTVFTGNGAQFENANVFNDVNTAAVQWDQTGAVIATFSNTGTYTRSGTGIVTLDVDFVNTATLDLTSGELSLTRQSTLGGGTTIASASVLRIDGGTHSASNGATFSGTGDLAVNGGTLAVDGAIVTADILHLSAGGTINGAGTLTVNILFDWIGGTLSGAGALNIDALATADITGGNTKSLITRTINNAGTFNWSGGTIFASDFATFNNSGAFLDANTTDVQWDQSGANVARFVNQATGTFTSSGAGATTFDVIFDNSNLVTTLDAARILRLTRGGTSDGGVFAAALGVIEFGGGTYDHINVATVTGAGEVAFTAGTTTIGNNSDYNVAGTTRITGGTANFDGQDPTALTGNLIMTGGVLAGEDVTVTSQFDWSGGTMSGPGATNVTSAVAVATMNILGPVTLNAGRTLQNDGIANWSAGANITGTSDALFFNAALGTLNLEGVVSLSNATFQTSGVISVDISGTGAGQFGQLNVTGSPSVSGFVSVISDPPVAVNLIGYTPVTNDTFSFLTNPSGNRVGSFGNAPGGFTLVQTDLTRVDLVAN